MTLRRLLWVLLLPALGCGSDAGSGPGGDTAPGGQTGEETVGCLPVERRPLAWSERSPLGFSADELLGALGSEREGRLVWASGGSTSLELALERGSAQVELLTREWIDDGSGRELAVGAECSDVVSVPATLSFRTSDGAFAERWPLTLLGESRTRASAFVTIALDNLDGNYEVTEVAPENFDEVLAALTLTLDSDAWSGTLSGQAIITGSSPDDTASATQFDIASF